MKLRPFTADELNKLQSLNANPADFAGFDDDTGEAVPRAEFDKTSALAPSNPYMAAIAEPVLRAGADIYRAGRRFPQAAAEMVFGKQADSAISAAGATPITAINFLAEQALSRGARGAAQFRQPGKADTALSTAAGLTSAIAPYFVNPLLGMSTSAMQGAGAGSEKAEAMGATPGQELANMTMRAGASAALDKIGMLGAAKTPMAWAPMAKLAARGALEGAATQGSFNVADKVTFNPNQDLSEGVATSALIGAAAPVALRGAGEGIARLQGSRPPVMQTRSPRSVLEEGARLSYDKRQAFVDQINKQYPDLFEGGLTLERLGGAEGNRMSDDAIRAIIDLASRAGEAPPLGSPNQQLVAQLARSGLIDPTNIAEARRVLNEGPIAFADIQARGAGLLAASRVNEVTAAQQAAEAAARGDVSASVRGVAEREAADQAAAREAAQAAEVARQAEATKRSAGVAAEMKNIVEGKAPYAPDAPLAHLVGGKPGVVERPMSAAQTLLAERETAAAARFEAPIKAKKMVARKVIRGEGLVDVPDPLWQTTVREGEPGNVKTVTEDLPPPAFTSAEEAMAFFLAEKRRAWEAGGRQGPPPTADDIQLDLTEVNIPDEIVTSPITAAQALKAPRPPKTTTIVEPGTPESDAYSQLVNKAEIDAAIEHNKRVTQNIATRRPAPETIVTGEAAKPPIQAPTAEHPVTGANAVTAATTAPTVPAVGKDAAIKPGAPSQAGTGTPKEAAKSAPAPTSVPLQPAAPSAPTSALRVPEGVSKNPSAAEVTAAAGAKETTPVSATPMTSALPLNDQIRASYIRALEEGRTKDVNQLAKLLRQRGVPVPDSAGAAPPAVETPRPLTSAVDASALPPALRELGVEAQDVNTRALRLEMEGKTAEADALRTQFAAKRRAAEATGFTSIPKSEVASPVATVKAEPAVKTEGAKLRLYRGTPADKSVMEHTDFGIHFSERKATASKFGGEKNKVHEVEVDIKNPVKVSDQGKAWDNDLVVDDVLAARKDIPDDAAAEKARAGEWSDLTDWLKRNNVDALYYDDLLEGGGRDVGRSWILFEHSKINQLGSPADRSAIPRLTDAGKAPAPAPLKIKQQTADPVAADRALLDQVGLVVRKKPDGNYELYNKEIDEVVRQLGGAANEAEAIGEAARSMRKANRPGGLGSKMTGGRRGEEGFVAVPEFVESAGKAVGSAVRSGLSRIRSATQQLADYGARAGDETAKYGARRLNETATVAAVDAQKIINENQRTWNALSAKEREELTDIIQYERAQRIAYAGRMSPRVKNAYFETRGLLRELGERAAREGPRIQEGKEWRPLIVDEFWAPESLSGKIIKQLQDTSIDKATGRTVRDGLIEEVRNWWRQNGMSEDQINTEIKRFDIESRTGDADIEFDALHRPMTLPLPPGWAGNTQDAINRYAQKYAFEMARHKYIDQDALLGPMSRGQRQSLDNLGRLTARPFEAGEVGETTESMFRAALNSFALQLNPGRRGLVNRLAGVANPTQVQTAAVMRDASMMLGTLIDDAGVKNAFKGLFDGIAKYRDLKERGLVRDTGTLSGDWQRLKEYSQAPEFAGAIMSGRWMDAAAAFNNSQIIESVREAVRMSTKGVAAVNKLMEAVSSAAGIARAKEAMVKGDEAFFRRVGIPEWRAKTPTEVEDYVARWVVEGSQGSMGAKDQPVAFLKNSGTGSVFAPLLRWSVAFSNQQIDRAIKPLFDSQLSAVERVKPMATRLAGATGASALANAIVQGLFGRDDRNITYKEWKEAGYPNKMKYVFQKAADLQLLPIVTTIGNAILGGQPMPRNLGVELPFNAIKQAAVMIGSNRELTLEDLKPSLDALFDNASADWRDLSKSVAGEVKDPIEQARARYDFMNQATTFNLPANPLNLTAQFNDAKTVDEALAIARRIVETATLETPDVSVRGPSEDAAFDKWLEKTDSALSRKYREKNVRMAGGADQLYNAKIALKDTVNAALEKKRALLMSKEPNEVKRAQGVKIDWESGGYRMK